jgi:calpain-7
MTNIYANQQYADPNGMLPLSLKQLEKLKCWCRAIDVLDSKNFVRGVPDVATAITGYEIMQKGVGDCSVLSSLAVTAHHEFKHHHKLRLISGNIFPQDQYGNPIYSPEGKYVVKLFLNGSWRGVEVDDYLPVDDFGSLICAYSNKSKLWVSLIEKAYLKAHGGYDFQGSNSSRDLYVLTGWLPEIIDLQTYDRQKLWQRISAGYRNRDCLITCGTGAIEDEDKIGLVSGHAYAILEIMEYKDVKMLMVKNPWGYFRYKGKFSAEDKRSWTPELKAAFSYDAVAGNDQGIFWIDLDTFCTCYESLYINWNPNLLTYRKSFFGLWKSAEMAHQNFISVKQNPQFQI